MAEMKQLVGIGNDSTKVQNVFDQSEVNACLLVFVSEKYVQQSGQSTLELLNKFNQASFEEKKIVQIAYPIYPSFEDGTIRNLWNKYNPGNWVPAFVFTRSNGDITGISHFGLPTLEQLSSELLIVIPTQNSNE